MTIYLANAFSPKMLKNNTALIKPVSLENVKKAYHETEIKSVISHEITAKLYTKLLDKEVAFNRESISLLSCDIMFCIIPNIRFDTAREFTEEELKDSNFSCYVIFVDEK